MKNSFCAFELFDLNGKMEKKGKLLDSLMTKKTILQKTIDKLRDQMKKKNAQLNLLQEKVDACLEDNGEKAKRIGELEAREIKNEALEEYAKQLEAQLESLKKDITALRFENDAYGREASEMKKSVREMEQKLERFQKQYEKDLVKIKESKRVAREKEEEARVFQKENESLEQEKRVMKADMRALRVEVKRSSETGKGLRIKNDDLKEELENMVEVADKLKAHCECLKREKKTALENIKMLEKTKKKADKKVRKFHIS